jgi:hypothetical protein
MDILLIVVQTNMHKKFEIMSILMQASKKVEIVQINRL